MAMDSERTRSPSMMTGAEPRGWMAFREGGESSGSRLWISRLYGIESSSSNQRMRSDWPRWRWWTVRVGLDMLKVELLSKDFRLGKEDNSRCRGMQNDDVSQCGTSDFRSLPNI